MADQSHHLPLLLAGRPIVCRSQEVVQRATGPYGDPANLLREALFHVDDGWYNAYWYGQQSAAKARMIPRLFRQLWDTIAAAGIIWYVRKAASGVREHHVPEATVAQKG
jgi:hypothetical protein